VRLVGCVERDGEAEPVEELGAQVALFRVHGPDEHEARRVLVGEVVALDAVHAGDRDVEEDVDEMVGEEVDLVHVEHAAVGRREETGLETNRAFGERGGEVEGADHAFLGGAQRQLDEGGGAG
jgi:hypothetical protein